MQFPDIARDLANDLIEEGVTKSKLADGLCDVSEAAYHYVKFYEILTSYHMALSER
jgi:predicted transcriptional regulator